MEKEKKYIIECTETQLNLISKCVDDCHRFAAGQPEMWNTLMYIENWRDARNVLQQIKLPEYDWAGNGCKNEIQRKFIAQTYAIYREIKHFFSVKYKHNDTYSSETLTCEEGLPLIKIKEIEGQNKNEKSHIAEQQVSFKCISKEVTMTVQQLIDYYIEREIGDVADECGF